jgi:hypothetical protein
MAEERISRSVRAAHLKERIYLTFTALSVLLAMRSHGEVEAGEALFTLGVTVLGTLLAILLADIVSHIAIHQRAFTREEWDHALATSVGAIGAVFLPFVFLGLAALGVLRTEGAIRASTIALIAGLVVIGYVAIRRTSLPLWQKVLALAAEAVLGLVVVALELLAHG